MHKETQNQEGVPTPNPQDNQKKGKNTGMAIVAYILFFIPLLTDAKNDPFVKYHIKQGLVLFISWVAVSVLSWIPPIMFISWILHLALTVLFVIGILHAINGEEKPLPFIGQFASKISI